MFKLKDYRDSARSYGDLLGWFAVIADGVIETIDGQFLASWYFQGEDLGCSTNQELANLSAQLNALLRNFDGAWACHVDCIRRQTKGYPKQGAFPDRTTRLIDEERRLLHEQEGAHFESIQVLTLAWQVPGLTATRVENWIYGEEGPPVTKAEHLDRMLAKFEELCGDFESAASGLIKLRRMKAYEGGEVDSLGRPEVFDEQLEYFEFCATGWNRSVRLPAVPAYLDREIGAVGIDTESLVANVGFATGNIVRLGSGHLVRTIGVTGFPADSMPALLSGLDRMDFEYRWSTRFIFMEHPVAEAALNKAKRHWVQKVRRLTDQIRGKHDGPKDQDAAEMALEVDAALKDLKSGLINFGHYTATVVVMERCELGNEADEARAVQELADKVKEVQSLLSDRGFESIREDINTADSFIGTMPGNRFANVRGAPIHTLHLADLLPLTTVWSGPEAHPNPLYPPMAPPLFYAETAGGTPFRVSLHVDDVGHCLVLGPTGAGKTTFLNLIMAQMFRYPGARVVSFDRKYGTEVLCKAAGGVHYDIGGDGAQVQFCPLAKIDTPADQSWAADWVETCLVLQNFSVGPAHRVAVYETIKKLADSGGSRSMSEFVGLLPTQELQQALNHYTLSGAAGYLLDSDVDTLRDSNFVCFEMEHLGQMGDMNLIPVLLYLFREIERRLNGEPTMVVLDESWMQLQSPVFGPKIQEWLKTLRSKCAMVVLSTQEPADFLNLPIKDVILASCPTRILLPNDDAKGVQRDLYRMLGCNDKEIELIASARKKEHYFYRSPVGRRLFSLGLGGATLAFVGATGKAAATEARALEAELGHAWVPEWLARRGQPEWAQYWRTMQ